jgi:ElaB/YqjD/DUF883 family membrane-anchored ribosome-binding protein
MAEDTAQMRARIEQQRDDITHTVDQIGNRVSPSHILARRQDRMRRRLTGWKDAVFGNDEPDFPPPRGDRYGFPVAQRSDVRDYYYDVGGDEGSDGGVRDRVGDAASSAASSVQHAPMAMRRQTRGNPMAAGAIAVGAGWLIGSLLPETASERRAIRRVEPQLAGAASEVKDEARGLVDDLREPAKDAAEHVKDRGRDAADEVKGQANQSAQNVRQRSSS